MRIHKALHPRDEEEVSWKEEGRGHTSIQESVDVTIQRLEDYMKNTEGDWFQWPETIQTTQASTEQK